MAKPTVMFNSSTGSDSISSGAGPDDGNNSGSSVSGSGCRCRNATNQTRLAFFDGSPPDLTDVDSCIGGNYPPVLYVADSTTGNANFGEITEVKNTTETTSAVTSSGSAVVAVIDSTGLSANDVVGITGAGTGGSTLYTTIASVDSAIQITLSENVPTTNASAVLTDPPQTTVITPFGTNSGGPRTTNSDWAIGGQRQYISSNTSKKLYSNNNQPGDGRAGWTLKLNANETHQSTTTLDFRRAGDSTDGFFSLDFNGYSFTGRNANQEVFRSVALYTRFYSSSSTPGKILAHASIAKSSSAVVAINGAGIPTSAYIENMQIGDSLTTGFYRGISNSSGCDFIIKNVTIGYCYDAGLYITANMGADIDGLYIHDCDQGAGNGYGIFLTGTPSGGLRLKNFIIERCRGDGIVVSGASTGTTGIISGFIINGDVYLCGGDGIEITCTSTSVQSLRAFTMENVNIIANGGYGINFTGSSISSTLLAILITRVRNCNFGFGSTANTSGPCNITPTSDFFENSLLVDPQYVDPDNATPALRNFSTGENVAELGYPTYILIDNATKAYRDIGFYQRKNRILRSFGYIS